MKNTIFGLLFILSSFPTQTFAETIYGTDDKSISKVSLKDGIDLSYTDKDGKSFSIKLDTRQKLKSFLYVDDVTQDIFIKADEGFIVVNAKTQKPVMLAIDFPGTPTAIKRLSSGDYVIGDTTGAVYRFLYENKTEPIAVVGEGFFHDPTGTPVKDLLVSPDGKKILVHHGITEFPSVGYIHQSYLSGDYSPPSSETIGYIKNPTEPSGNFTYLGFKGEAYQDETRLKIENKIFEARKVNPRQQSLSLLSIGPKDKGQSVLALAGFSSFEVNEDFSKIAISAKQEKQLMIVDLKQMFIDPKKAVIKVQGEFDFMHFQGSSLYLSNADADNVLQLDLLDPSKVQSFEYSSNIRGFYILDGKPVVILESGEMHLLNTAPGKPSVVVGAKTKLARNIEFKKIGNSLLLTDSKGNRLSLDLQVDCNRYLK